MKKVLILFSVALILVFVSVACEAGKKGTNIEGKVVDKDGKPLSGVKVVAIQQEPLKGYEKFETKTKGDGIFVFKGLYPKSAYKLLPEGGQCNSAKKEIYTGPAGETKMLNDHIVLKFSPFKISNDGVITDSRTGLEWAPAPNKAMNWDEANQYVQSLSLAGGGWRLPTRVELRGLYRSGKTGCGIGREFLNEGSAAWSSELDGSSYAWSFRVVDGNESSDYSAARALAVRSRR
ncbi:MAG: DUF1566 domain-containing protein [Thermodesulfovibrionales bacterium]|nr:DUF1566 domain-containing protein [Thermodesulfovibrionales bacterium]